MAHRLVQTTKPYINKTAAAFDGDLVYGEVMEFLKKHHLDARKSLGQNFLVKEEPLITACQAGEVEADDFVLEIGPGPGTLTRRLAEKAGVVVAVELDHKIAAALQKEFKDTINVFIIHGNALDVDPQQIYEQYGRGLKFKVVANIPYYITSALLRHYLSGACKPQIMVMLMQKEVAMQAANQKNKSLLSLSVQYYGTADVVSLVPKNFFYPQPKVDSAFLRIKIGQEILLDVNEESFFNLARHAFNQSRKTLLNSLSASMGVNKEEMTNVLQEAGQEFLEIRAGALTFAQWQKLYDTMRSKMTWR